MKKRLVLLLLTIFAFNAQAHDDAATNKDGSIVSGILTAGFDPFGSARGEQVIPFPSSLALMTTTDLTLDIPVEDPDDFTDPAAALSALDGWSTTEKWVTSFYNGLEDGNYKAPGAPGSTLVPGSIDPTSVVPGQSVRLFEVTTYQFLAVTSIVRELTPGLEFVAVSAEGGKVVIIPTSPLKEYTSYMAVLTNDIRDTNGNNSSPDVAYNFGKTQTPWVDEEGHSTYGLFSDEEAADLELIRRLVQSMELNAAAYGVNPADIVLSWTVHTQSITPTLKRLRAIAQPAPTTVVPTGKNTSVIGARGLADIHIGIITLPYYLGVASAENPIAPLSDFWNAAPGAYVPPYDQLGLDPTSTHITFANPWPVLTGMQTVPLLVTVPNANSGFSKPDEGWPVVIYVHGVTRSRMDVLAIADSIASAGYVVVSMDQPLHGVVPDVDPHLADFYIENTPFAPVANERTFDADYWNNETGALGPDGVMDPSGRNFMNLANARAIRDNFRQAETDYSILALSLQNMSIDGDDTPDLNALNVAVVSHSAGGFVAVPFVALEPIVSRLYLGATAGGIMRTFNGGHYGPDFVQPFLSAFAGIEVGTPEFEQAMVLYQTVFDSGDSINWAAELAPRIPIIHNQVMQDGTVPNVVPGAPLAGSEALNNVLGLMGYSTTKANPEGFSGVARFQQPADHESLFKPFYPEVTAEMQKQMATFIASKGTFVEVGNPDLLVPEVQIDPQPAIVPIGKKGKKHGPRLEQVGPAKSPEVEIWIESLDGFK